MAEPLTFVPLVLAAVSASSESLSDSESEDSTLTFALTAAFPLVLVLTADFLALTAGFLTASESEPDELSESSESSSLSDEPEAFSSSDDSSEDSGVAAFFFVSFTTFLEADLALSLDLALGACAGLVTPAFLLSLDLDLAMAANVWR